jgi:hypothetical protein
LSKRRQCERLREENARLRLRIGDDLEGDHQDVERPSLNGDVKGHPSAAVTVDSPPQVKVSLFKDLFRARNDVYAVRWEGRNGKTGYSPAGEKEWDKALSGRGPKKSFRLTKLFSLTDEVVRDHLLGKQTIGVYPLLQDDTCWFVAVDFDKKSWKADACAFLKLCHETGVPASLERSRSGNGGHVWIFFANPVQAALARKLASAFLTRRWSGVTHWASTLMTDCFQASTRAQGRIRKPHCPSLTAPSSRKRQQRFSRRSTSAV